MTAALAAPLPASAPLAAAEDPARRLYDAFLSGRSANTRRTYEASAADFASWLSVRRGRELGPAEALRELLAAGPGPANLLTLDYRAALFDRGLAPGTVALRISALRSAVKLGRLLGAVTWALEVPAPRAQAYRDTRGPGRDAVRAMMAALAGRPGDRQAVRDLALLHLLYDLGLRRAEAASLDLEHLDLAGARVSVLRKGKHDRLWLTLPSPTVRAVEAWLAVRGLAPGPLLTARDGRRLEASGVYRAVRRMGVAAGVEAPVRPHGLRHTAITTALERAQRQGIGLERVRDFSGHADVSTLMVYADKLEDMQGRIAALVADDPD